MANFLDKERYEAMMQRALDAALTPEERRLKYPSDNMEEVYKTGITFAMGQRFLWGDSDTMTCELSFPIRKWQLNPGGTMHGGMVATAFDNALGSVVVCAYPDEHVSTIHQAVTYLKPIFMEHELIIRVKCVNFGRSVMTLTGEAFSNDELCATATGIYRIRPRLEGQEF